MQQQASDRLVVRGITVRFSGITALSDVSLEVEPGRVLGVIGPNGAGKTTLVNVLTGLQKPMHGRFAVGGQEMNGRPAHIIARNGIARTFQGVRLFKPLSVWENIAAGAIGMRRDLRATYEITAEVLDWVGLQDKADLPAGLLPYGEERMVGIARALTMSPRYLLMDEPAAGLNEAEGNLLVNRIRAIPGRFGCGVLLIEHNMRIIMRVCQRLHVLDGGRTIASGETETVRKDPKVIEAYLGTKKGKTHPA